MAETTLQIRVRVRDDGTIELLDRAERKVERLGHAGGKAAGTLTSAFAKAAGAIGAAFAAWRVADFVRDSVELANVQEEAFAKVEAVVRATGGAAGFAAEEMARMASALQEVTTYGDEAILGAQSVLATFKEVKGDVFRDATQAILDLSTVMNQDLKSSAVQLGKALNDPIQGVSALQEVGVSFTESQKEQIEALVESGRVMEAQRLILAELESEFGGVAKAAASTFGGALKQVSNAWGDLKEAIGAYLTQSPAAVGALKGLTEVLSEWGQEVKAWGSAGLGTIGAWIDGLEVLGQAFLGLRWVWNQVQRAYGWFAEKLNQGWERLVAGFQWGLERLNFGGIFDEQIARMEDFRRMLSENARFWDRFTADQREDLDAVSRQWDALGAAMDRIRARAAEAVRTGLPATAPAGGPGAMEPAVSAGSALPGRAEADRLLAEAKTQADTLKTLREAWKKAEDEYAAHLKKLEDLRRDHAERMRSIDDRVANLGLRLIDDPAERAQAEMRLAFERIARQKDLADSLTGAQRIEALERYIDLVEQAAHAWEAGGQELLSEKDAVAWAIQQIRSAQGEIESTYQAMARAEREAAETSAVWADSLSADAARVQKELEGLGWQLEEVLARSGVDIRVDLVDLASEGLERLRQALDALAAGVTVPVDLDVQGSTLVLAGGGEAAPLIDGQMHAGGVVPRTGTYFLEGGEVVIPRGGAAAPGVTVQTGDIVIQGGADAAETERAVLRALERADWQRIARRHVAPEMERMERRVQ